MTLLVEIWREVWKTVGVLAPLVLGLLVAGLILGGPSFAGFGVWKGLLMFWDTIPRFALAFIVAGLIQVVVPNHVVKEWLGKDSGMKGILVGGSLGGVTPGGPYVFLPVVAALLKQGAGVGPIGAFLGGKTYNNLMVLVTWEIPIIGLTFALAMHIVTILFPYSVGLLVPPILDVLERRKGTIAEPGLEGS
ncbi:MAG: permease [Chloroflexi bacterium]|nr:permease [Chloroflexota bacterium]